MSHYRSLIFAAAIAYSAIPAALAAQTSEMSAGECRPADAAESAAIAKAYAAVKASMDAVIAASGWVGDAESVPTQVAVKPQLGAPMEVCSDLVRYRLQLNPESQRSHAIDSAAAAITEQMQSDTSIAGMTKLMARMSEAMSQRSLDVRVIVNESYLYYQSPAPLVRIAIPAGAAFATRETMSGSEPTKTYETQIYVGDFTGAAAAAAAHKTTRLTFKHAKGPFIENILVSIAGPPAIVDDFTRRIDWAKIAAALSP